MKIENSLIRRAIKHLKNGGIVVYPTETAYGFGADARNIMAVRRIFKLKKRAPSKSLSVIVASLAMAERFVKFSPLTRKLAKKYWPGPLTLVLEMRPRATLARGVARGRTLAIRISSNPIARALSRGLGAPIIATSANISGHGECYSIAEVKRQFRIGNFENLKIGKLFIIDVGKLLREEPSTIVQIKNNHPKILRQGKIILS